MKRRLGLLLLSCLLFPVLARCDGLRQLQADWTWNFLGFSIDERDIQSSCPDEFSEFIQCAAMECFSLVDFECPEGVWPNPGRRQGGVPSCPDLAAAYCQTYGACCMSNCSQHVYAVALCIIRNTTTENRDDCAPPPNCGGAVEEEDDAEISNNETTTTTTTTTTSDGMDTGKCFGTPILSSGRNSLGSITQSCDGFDTLSTCQATPGCYWSASGVEPECWTNEDCDEGFFCSIFSNGTRSCQELTCANWQLGPPEGKSPSSEDPCPVAGNFFCGIDGNCYVYSCSNWYQYGPEEFTGYDSTDPVELVCEEYLEGSEENAHAVVFGCQNYRPGESVPSNVLVLPFNQRCHAQLVNTAQEFTCYEMQPSTEYRDFQIQLAQWDGPDTCDPTIYDSSRVPEPLFWYQTFFQTENPVVTQTHNRYEYSNIFYENLAEKAVFAKLVSDGDVLSLDECSILNASPTVCAALLANTTQVCDCYNFCNGELVECLDAGERSWAFVCGSDSSSVRGCSWDLVNGTEIQDVAVSTVRIGGG